MRLPPRPPPRQFQPQRRVADSHDVRGAASGSGSGPGTGIELAEMELRSGAWRVIVHPGVTVAVLKPGYDSSGRSSADVGRLWAGERPRRRTPLPGGGLPEVAGFATRLAVLVRSSPVVCEPALLVGAPQVGPLGRGRRGGACRSTPSSALKVP